MAKDKRPSAARRGYGYKWNKARAEFLAVNPWCVTIWNGKVCGAPATQVDHNHPIDSKLGTADPTFWDQSNWRPRCHSCHSRKTATKRNANLPLVDSAVQLSLLALSALEHTTYHKRQSA